MNSHLPLTLGEYRTARGMIEIVRIGKRGRWALDEWGSRWHVSTGKHANYPSLNIIARHDPDAERARAMVDDGIVVPDHFGTREGFAEWAASEAATITALRSELARSNAQVTKWRDARQTERAHLTTLYQQAQTERDSARAERDDAVALLRMWAGWENGTLNTYSPSRETHAFLAKIGGG